jgi:hypothetical protein
MRGVARRAQLERVRSDSTGPRNDCAADLLMVGITLTLPAQRYSGADHSVEFVGTNAGVYKFFEFASVGPRSYGL